MQKSQVIIVVLLVLNLAATVWFGLNGSVVSPKDRASLNALPPVFTEAEKTRLYNRFQRTFNAGDFEALYQIFGPGAQALFSEDRATAEFSKLKRLFDTVSHGTFQRSEFAGNKGSTNYYNLYYSVKFSDNSEVGSSGTLKITVATDEAGYQVYGIRLHSGL
ncbi:hypothetical protein [Thalassolituus sp.]|uniref:hypothetical protein n=1 Tax=Thalassolituus sp. TaxID=2030822 RepID=UPI0035110A4C